MYLSPLNKDKSSHNNFYFSQVNEGQEQAVDFSNQVHTLMHINTT